MKHVAVADVREGDVLYPDDGFTCMGVNEPKTVFVEYYDNTLANALREMLAAYDSDDGHGPIKVIEQAREALIACAELYVYCASHKRNETARHYLNGQIKSIDGVDCYVGFSKEPWT